MKDKDRYYHALKENKGKLNELELGEYLGLDQYNTTEIIAQLLSEHKIEYTANAYCHYRLKKRENRNSRFDL